MAIRPKTLYASIAPVLIGTSMAFGDGVHDFSIAGIVLLAAVLIQIGTNFVNDYCDHKAGVDTAERLGPVRVTQAGLVKPATLKWVSIFIFVLVVALAVILYERGGWPIAVIAVSSILAGILYTAGSRPLGYLGWGEFLVFIFFGPVAVAGTYYLQSLEMNSAVVLAGFAPGFLSCAVLTVNNLRDIATDSAAGKKTMAVRFGRSFATSEYLFFILAAALMPVSIFFITQDHLYTLVSVVICLAAIPLASIVYSRTDGPSLNLALADTGKLLLVYSVLFSLGWIL